VWCLQAVISLLSRESTAFKITSISSRGKETRAWRTVSEEAARVVRSLPNGERRDFAGLPCSPTPRNPSDARVINGSTCHQPLDIQRLKRPNT
jgi:hypothetical protein